MIARLWLPFRHVYVLLVVMVSWVFFRAETLTYGLQYLGVMYGVAAADSVYPLVYIGLDVEFYTTLFLALVLSTPLYTTLLKRVDTMPEERQTSMLLPVAVPVAKCCLLGSLLLFSAMNLATGAYNPFIYFRF